MPLMNCHLRKYIQFSPPGSDAAAHAKNVRGSHALMTNHKQSAVRQARCTCCGRDRRKADRRCK